MKIYLRAVSVAAAILFAGLSLGQDEPVTSPFAGAVQVYKPGTDIDVVEPQREIVLPVGQSIVVSTKFQLVALEECSANAEVCMASVLTDENADPIPPPRHCRIQAVKHGSTTVTLLPTDPFIGPVTVKIIIVEDQNRYSDVEKLINEQFPGSRIRIYPVPTSNRILVVGEVEDETDVEDVTNLLTTDDVPVESIINRLHFRNHRFKSVEVAIKKAYPRTKVRIVPIPGAPTLVVDGTVENDEQMTSIETMLTGLVDAEGNSLAENVILKLEIGEFDPMDDVEADKEMAESDAHIPGEADPNDVEQTDASSDPDATDETEPPEPNAETTDEVQ